MGQVVGSSWFSLSWFSYDLIFEQFEYERPYMLYLVFFLPIILISYGCFRIIKGSNLKVNQDSGSPLSYMSLFGLLPWFFFMSLEGSLG